jgi:hypothetical protein
MNLISQVASGAISPQIGMWFAFCCHHDLHQIGSDEEIADIRESCQLAEDGIMPLPRGLWSTKEDALAELAIQD